MRAVVIGVKGSKAAVAFKGGGLRYIENEGFERGQILDIPREEPSLTVIEGKKGKSIPLFRFTPSVAAAASVFLLTGAVTAYAFPASTVTIDVNPSLSMGINIFDRVVTADYANDDGEELLHDISPDLIGKKLPDAVNIVFDGMEERDFINGPDIPAASTVDCRIPGRRRDRIMEELRSSAEDWNRAHKDRSVSFEVEPMTPDLRIEAYDKGMTPGQVMLERSAPKAPDDITELPPDNTDSGGFEAPTEDNSGSTENETPPADNGSSDKSGNSPVDNGSSGKSGNPPADSGNSGKSGNPPADNGSSGGFEAPPADNGNSGGFEAPPADNGSSGGFEAPPADNGSFGGFEAPPADNGSSGGGEAPPADNGSFGGFEAPPADNGSFGGFEAPPADNGSFGGFEAPPADNGNSGGGEVPPADNGGSGGLEAPPADNGGSDRGSEEPDPGSHGSERNNSGGRDHNNEGPGKGGGNKGPGGPGK